MGVNIWFLFVIVGKKRRERNVSGVCKEDSLKDLTLNLFFFPFFQ